MSEPNTTDPPNTTLAGGSSILAISARSVFVAFAIMAGIFSLMLWGDSAKKLAVDSVAHTLVHENKIKEILLTLLDAETSQRGFLLTGLPKYLEPFNIARPRFNTLISELSHLTKDNFSQQEHISKLKPLIAVKIDELLQTIQLRRLGKEDEAIAMVLSDKGKHVMDEIRDVVSDMVAAEDALLTSRQQELETVRTLVIYGQLALILLLAVVVVVVTSRVRSLIKLQQIAEKSLLESEAGYNALTKVAPVGIFRTDVDGMVIYVNEKWCELGGITLEESQGSGWKKALHPDDRVDAGQLWEKYISEGIPFRHEQRYQMKEGYISLCISQAMPETGANGNIIGHVGIITDITEQKALSEKLKESRDEAEAANVAKSNFLSTMSHEIRTPLHGVLGLAQLLTDSDLNRDQRKKVDTILSSGQALLAIINDVLDMSKIEAGGIELEEKAFSLRNLISMIATPFQSLAGDKGLKLKVVNEIVSDLVVKGDPVRLRQVLWNLLNNAIKFTDTGDVTLIMRELSGPGRHGHLLHFSVEDTGTGIAADKIDAIFEPFTQEDSSITRKYGGTGLGLSIVKQLTEIMSGSIDVESKFGEGTKFNVYIQFSSATPEEIDTLSLQDTPDGIAQVSPLNVLIAEDSEVNALITKSFLEKFGHHVKHVENGKLAVEAAMEGWADLILMDIHMPEMNGIDATKSIRSSGLGVNLPIIGLTAAAFVESHAHFVAAGMDGVLTKPFTERQLVETLAAYRPREHGESKVEMSLPEAKEGAAASVDENSRLSHDAKPVGDDDGLDALRKQIGLETLARLLTKSQDTLQIRMEEIRQGIASSNPDQIAEAAHSIRGVGGSMYAIRISELAAFVEGQSTDIMVIQKILPEFEAIAADTIQWWRDHSN